MKNKELTKAELIEKLKLLECENKKLIEKVNILENKNIELEIDNKALSKVGDDYFNRYLELSKNSKSKPKNERGAGRKQKFNDADIENIKIYRLQKKTIKEIAEIYSCSVGLIHKLINEK